ncbi:MAG: hypothetical protein JSS04_06070 [Proteobacteria bacterium]|nr:hypothetical protein [Pseudomonadota bacterium]
MFTLAFDRRHRILLTRVSGAVGSADASALDGAIQRFTAHHGPVHGVVDFTAVSTVVVPIGRLVHQQTSATGYKQIVVASDRLAELARTAARESLVVSSMDEALHQLGAVNPSFEPVDPL